MTSTSFTHTGGHIVAVDDAQLYVEEAGRPDGPPLLCLHGGLGDMRDLNPVLPVLAERFRLIGMDLRGHGRSTPGSAPLTYALYQADVLAVMRQMGITAARVLGFSDGGITGLRLAADGASGFRVQYLAVIGAQWRLTADDPALPMLQGLTLDAWNVMFPDAVPYYQSHNPQPDFNKLLDGVKALWTNAQPGNYPGESVQNIIAPTLLIRGDEDGLCALPELTALRSLLAGNSALLNVSLAGHAAQADAPAIVAPALTAFFN